MEREKTGLILPYKGIVPKIGKDAFLAPMASVMGDVEIGAGSNLWFGVVVRGDVNAIRIGENTNLQDGTVVHATRKTNPTIIGNGITVGHRAVLHGCTLEDGCFVGMGATVMDGAVVEGGTIVGAGALVTPGKRVMAGEVWVGIPARKIRNITDEELAFIPRSAENYKALAGDYMAEGVGRLSKNS